MSKVVIPFRVPFHSFSGQGRLRHLLSDADSFFRRDLWLASEQCPMTRRDMLKWSTTGLGIGALALGCPASGHAAVPMISNLVVTNVDKVYRGGAAIFFRYAAKILKDAGDLFARLIVKVTEEVILDFLADALYRALRWSYELIFGETVKENSLLEKWRQLVLWIKEKFVGLRRAITMGTIEHGSMRVEEEIRIKREIVRSLGPGYERHAAWSDQVLVNRFTEGELQKLQGLKAEPKHHSKYGTVVGWHHLGLPSELRLSEAEQRFGDRIFLPETSREARAFFDHKDLGLTDNERKLLRNADFGNEQLGGRPDMSTDRDVVPAAARKRWPKSSNSTTEKIVKLLNECYSKKEDLEFQGAAITHDEVLYGYPLRRSGGQACTGFGIRRKNSLGQPSRETFVVLQEEVL
ncbi:MAG: hypothetical protein R3E01_05670 [Pirellulaceae bacterium]